MKQKLINDIFPPQSGLHIIDGITLPICKYARSYRYKSLKPLAENNIQIHTPKRQNMKDDRPKTLKKMLSKKRKMIETTFRFC